MAKHFPESKGNSAGHKWRREYTEYLAQHGKFGKKIFGSQKTKQVRGERKSFDIPDVM